MTRVVLGLLLSTLVAVAAARAHEIQPTVADVTVGADEVEIRLEWVLESPVAGLDLEGIENTNAAANADEYDRLRALPPEDLAAAFREAWPRIADSMPLRAGDALLKPEIRRIEVPPVGDLQLPRLSIVEIAAPLPAGDAPVVLSWPAGFGPLVVRQAGVEDGYAAFLPAGGDSAPIPRSVAAEEQSAGSAFIDYVGVGFDHIVPLGLDHILFVLGLYFLALRLGALLWQVTAFTLAHTVTLALGALDIIRIPAEIVEPLIAASIVYVGVENVVARRLTPWRPAVVFGFGLLHGLGFASVLTDFGLGKSHFVAKLIGFNVGVELGQLAVIGTAFLVAGLLFGRETWYVRRIAAPVSAAIAVIAAFWVLERTGLASDAGIWAPLAAVVGGGLPPVPTALMAGGLSLAATALTVSRPGDLGLAGTAGMVTSFAIFVAIIATFTAGAWNLSAILSAVWVLTIRLQSLSGATPGAGEGLG